MAIPASGTAHCSSLSGDNGQINFQEQSKESGENCLMDMPYGHYDLSTKLWSKTKGA